MKATTKERAPKAPTQTEPPRDAPRKPRRISESLNIAIFIIAAVMVGILITIFINSNGNDEQQGLEVALNSKYGDDWRGLGVIRWTYDPITATVFYYDPDEWEALARERQVEVLKKLSADIKDYRAERDEEQERLFIMVHDVNSVMLAAYSPEDGLIEY